MYSVLVLIHILSAMVWVGGGFLLVAVIRRARRRGGQEHADQLMRELEWVDTRIFTPAPLLVIATGLTMVIVSDAWAFSQPWIYLALTLIVIEFVAGDRELKRMAAAREKGTISSPEYGATLRRYLTFGTLAVSMLAVVAILMVFKPGA